MPKLFASEIVIHDRATGESVPARVEVNHPASYRGIEIYQSSFDDGGSLLKLRAVPMAPGVRPFEVEGTVGGSTRIERAGTGEKGSDAAQALTLEFTGLRTITSRTSAPVPVAPARTCGR